MHAPLHLCHPQQVLTMFLLHPRLEFLVLNLSSEVQEPGEAR